MMKKYKIKQEEGEDRTAPLTNFSKIIKKLNLNDKIVDNLKKAGYKRPTPIQMIAIPLMYKVLPIIFLSLFNFDI
jgi:superfamily II DNA/RNA helicase